MRKPDGIVVVGLRSRAMACERARAAFAELVEPRHVADGHELPAVAKVGSARRP